MDENSIASNQQILEANLQHALKLRIYSMPTQRGLEPTSQYSGYSNQPPSTQQRINTLTIQRNLELTPYITKLRTKIYTRKRLKQTLYIARLQPILFYNHKTLDNYCRSRQYWNEIVLDTNLTHHSELQIFLQDISIIYEKPDLYL